MSGSLTVTIDTSAAQRSLESIRHAIAALEVAETCDRSLLDSLKLFEHRSDLVRVETARPTASGACVLEALQILPGDGYLEMVSALVGNGNAHIASEIHGWPVLSVVSAQPTVAKAGGESISARGGAA